MNTLLSQWSGSHQKAGWTFGITSAKSAYEPRNFIMQLIGENIGGDTIYRVIDSNLQIPLGKTHYLSCSVTLNPKGDSHVHFVWKDLETRIRKFRKPVSNMTSLPCNPSLPMNYFLEGVPLDNISGMEI